MGINDLLPHLPGGGSKDYRHSFYGALAKQTTVPLDAASALFQFAARHASDYLSGNLTPALVEWSRFLNYARSICKWKLIVIMDGLDNIHKAPENDRRRVARENAQANNNLMGQIKNTPEYIARATQVCKFMNITVRTAYEEADPQVVYEATRSESLIPVTGDSDLLAYECDGVSARKIIIVKAFNHQWYRFIDLDADVEEGVYPLRDMRIQHGVIVFRLYAACRGCDFTVSKCGIEGIGYKTFIELVATAVDGGKELNANTLALAIWEHNNDIARNNNFNSSDDIEEYLQHIVDIYSNGSVYDRNSNVINMGTGIIINKADELSLQHMTGEVNCRTKAPHSEELLAKIRDTDYSQLIKVTAEDTSTIRGANLPTNKTIEQCSVAELRDYIAARGGTITNKNKAALIKLAKYYQLVETEVRVPLVDRNPAPGGMLYSAVDTSCTRGIGEMLDDLLEGVGSSSDVDADIKSLVKDTHKYYSDGLFDDNYDNISRTAPELKESLIYQFGSNVGSSVNQKSIGDALRRCLYATNSTYHAMALLPESNKAILLTKCQASMARDEKTRNKTDIGEPCELQQYLVIIELIYKPSDDIEDGHNFGIFVEVGRHYCTRCIAGQGKCRHKGERLWYQYHHWTDERFGIDRPTTIDACSWHPGGKPLECAVRSKIHAQQTVKHELSTEEQTKKIKRGVKRDCTEGDSCEYVPHMDSRKMNPPSSLQFSKERTAEFFRLLREQS